MAVEILRKTNVSTVSTLTSGMNVLVPKFIRWKHILVDAGNSGHSEVIFPVCR